MIDRDGYRPNVGIVICNAKNQVFWGKRVKEHAWQFPQGGIKSGETPEQAMYRELKEETGLEPHHVKILGRTRNWLHYDVPHVLVGSMNGRVKGNRHIAYPTKTVPTGSLLLTILDRFGISQDSVGDSEGKLAAI